MVVKQYIRSYLLIGISSLLSLLTLSTTAMASPAIDSAISAKERNSDGLSQGLPGRRLGGGTRSERIFTDAYSSLVALTAPSDLSITTALRPKLLFYVPEMITANAVEFVLLDQNDELVYETSFEVAATGGFIDINPTASMPPLALNRNYQWYFSIIPEASDRSHDVAVYGSIRRVRAANWLAQQQLDTGRLSQLTPLLKARVLYQQADLWLEAAVILDQLRRQYPNDAAIAAEWAQLLELAGLPPASSQRSQLNRASRSATVD